MNVLPVGQEMLRWIRSGGRPTRCGASTLLAYRWQSWWFERNLAIQRRLKAPQIDSRPMIFIVGMWRSGTTFLHNLLSTNGAAIFPATWQCMNASTVGLLAAPAPSAPVTRPMGDIPVGSTSPQECEFALLSRGAPSVYRALLDPRRIDKLESLLGAAAWQPDAPTGWMETYKDFLARVAVGHEGHLVINSPTNTFRIRALAESLPKSVFVWIARPPRETFLSNRHMWTAMFERYALWDWDLEALDHFIVEAMRQSALCLDAATSSLPRSRFIVLDYGQFVANPVESVKVFTKRLGFNLSDSDCRSLVTGSATPVNRRQHAEPAGRYPEELRLTNRVMAEVQDRALRSHGI